MRLDAEKQGRRRHSSLCFPRTPKHHGAQAHQRAGDFFPCAISKKILVEETEKGTRNFNIASLFLLNCASE